MIVRRSTLDAAHTRLTEVEQRNTLLAEDRDAAREALAAALNEVDRLRSRIAALEADVAHLRRPASTVDAGDSLIDARRETDDALVLLDAERLTRVGLEHQRDALARQVGVLMAQMAGHPSAQRSPTPVDLTRLEIVE